MNFSIDSLALDKVQAKTQNAKTKTKKVSHFWQREGIKPVMAAVSLLCILLISFGSYAQAYQNKIYPGIKIAGQDLGGKTKSEAEQVLKKVTQKIAKQKISAEVSDKSLTTNLTNIGIVYDPGNLAQNAYQVGHGKNWAENIKQLALLTYEYRELGLNFELNNKKWNKFLADLSANMEQKAEEPRLELQNGKIEIVLGQPGINIETDKLKQEILKKTADGDFNKIIVPVTKSQITVPEDQATAIISRAENYCQPISLTFEGTTFTADKGTIFNWLVLARQGEKFSLSISDSAIAGYVASVANKIDVAAKDNEVTPAGEIISQGQEGRALNRPVATAGIKAALTGGSRQIALATSPVPAGNKTIYPAGTPGLFPGKYIEIVLAKQTLYAFDGPTLVRSFLISSGLASHPSPQGMFAIYTKVRSELMQGPGYYLPGVEWVNKFNGPYSIHGTYWHHNFGHPMSHGCINATNGDAAFIYDWAPIGTPVYVHY